MRYILDISYDGSKFYGFQRQKDKRTVQLELEKVLSKILKDTIVVKGAGRTDRGVHAHHQMVHFDSKLEIEPYRFRKIINDRVKPNIFINKCEVVNNNFHVRFDTLKKVYLYKINLGEFDPIQDEYLYNLNHNLDICRMKQFSKYLLGEHSYRYFVSSKRDNYDSNIYDIDIKVNNSILDITFTGKTFYTYMVRNLVGFLIEVGKGKYLLNDFDSIFSNIEQNKSYVCVPSNGLYLEEIIYKQ